MFFNDFYFGMSFPKKNAVHFQKKIALLSPEDGYKCNFTRLPTDTDLLKRPWLALFFS